MTYRNACVGCLRWGLTGQAMWSMSFVKLTGVLVKPLLLSMIILTRTTDKPPRSALPPSCSSTLQPSILHKNNELCNLSLEGSIPESTAVIAPLLCLQKLIAASGLRPLFVSESTRCGCLPCVWYGVDWFDAAGSVTCHGLGSSSSPDLAGGAGSKDPPHPAAAC